MEGLLSASLFHSVCSFLFLPVAATGDHYCVSSLFGLWFTHYMAASPQHLFLAWMCQLDPGNSFWPKSHQQLYFTGFHWNPNTSALIFSAEKRKTSTSSTSGDQANGSCWFWGEYHYTRLLSKIQGKHLPLKISLCFNSISVQICTNFELFPNRWNEGIRKLVEEHAPIRWGQIWTFIVEISLCTLTWTHYPYEETWW